MKNKAENKKRTNFMHFNFTQPTSRKTSGMKGLMILWKVISVQEAIVSVLHDLSVTTVYFLPTKKET